MPLAALFLILRLPCLVLNDTLWRGLVQLKTHCFDNKHGAEFSDHLKFYDSFRESYINPLLYSLLAIPLLLQNNYCAPEIEYNLFFMAILLQTWEMSYTDRELYCYTHAINHDNKPLAVFT